MLGNLKDEVSSISLNLKSVEDRGQLIGELYVNNGSNDSNDGTITENKRCQNCVTFNKIY